MARKSVLITGCGEGGIGAALAAQFQLQGLQVITTVRDVTKLQKLSDTGDETLTLDVTSDESIAMAVAAVSKATGGKLDFLINNAGVWHSMPFIDTKVEDFRHVMETNVVGVFAVTRAFLPLLIEAKGTVVTVGSLNEIFRPPFSAAYTTSKAAVHALSDTLRVELQPLGVKCIVVMSGAVRTKLFDKYTATIPADSIYAPIAAKIEKRDFTKSPAYVDPQVYAQQVVGDILKTKPPMTIWRGGLTTIAWLVSVFGRDGMLVSSKLPIRILTVPY